LTGEKTRKEGQTLAQGWVEARDSALHYYMEVPLNSGRFSPDGILSLPTDGLLIDAYDTLRTHEIVMTIVIASLLAVLLVIMFYMGVVFARDARTLQLVVDSYDAEDYFLLQEEATNRGFVDDHLLIDPTENEMDNLLNIVGPGKGTLNKISETLFPEQAEWNAIINKAKDSIEEGEFEKVVLARKKITKYNRAIHARDLMPVIENKGVGCFHILYRPDPNALFMSLTPERLFSLKNKTIQIDAIAGTRKRGMDSASDKMLEEEMLNSSKELHEHRLVSDQVEDFLKE